MVGVFDAGGSAFDSEVWCDTKVFDQVYQRPENVFQSLTVQMTSPGALKEREDSVIADSRLTVQVDREVGYYE